jgi:cation transport ATPase
MRNSGLLDFCAYLENTPLALTIQGSFWIVPLMQTLHILSISALLISALMMNLRMLNIVGKSDVISVVISRYIHIIWFALPVLLISGGILIVGEPARSLANPAFQMKMVMLIAVIGITVGIQRIGSTGNDQMQAKGIVQLLAVLAVLLWLGIVACGRWIAYT